jgi:undecaprenyl-diphosphatase
MIQFLSLDTKVFFLINHLPHTFWTDFFAEAFSGFGYAWIIWLGISMVLFIRKEKKDHWFWVPLGIAAVLCYVLSEVLFKDIFERPRPDALFGAIIVGSIPSSFSFPSTHATVAFAFAYLFSRKDTHWMWIYALAVLVCFSRIYLGHHYPIDVLVGVLLGTGIGMAGETADIYLHRIHRRLHHQNSKKVVKKV